jgi:hypothetical protein
MPIMNKAINRKGVALAVVLMTGLAHGALAQAKGTLVNGSNQAPKLTEREKEIARKVAAKEPLHSIIAYYAQKGVPITDIVYSCIKAGVDPGQAVYTAIIDGYSARPVVAYSLRAGAPLDKVVEAALGAGADKRFVYLGATDAGVSVGAIATAVSSNAAPAANAADPSPSTARASAVYIPAGPVLIGGGGGATPSTKRASPYRP